MFLVCWEVINFCQETNVIHMFCVFWVPVVSAVASGGGVLVFFLLFLYILIDKKMEHANMVTIAIIKMNNIQCLNSSGAILPLLGWAVVVFTVSTHS